MKTLSIGRDTNCDIVINDSTDVISRRHALLNVTPSGKMTIIDQSSNGTYVNGIRISQNVPVPVTRKDIISFAHVAKLDWNFVPKSNQWMKYAIGGFVALIVIVCIIFGIKSLNTNNGQIQDNAETTLADSISKAQEKAHQDSIKNAEQDSIAKAARQDSIRKAKKQQNKVEESKKESQQAEPKKPESRKPEQKKPEEQQTEKKKPTRVAG
jgi:pSer/pThr/pTyr-binding forkhead associated (FHA) protein